MVAQVVIFSPQAQHESRLIERLRECTSALATCDGCRNSFVIRDPSWHTLLLLILWEHRAAYSQAQPALGALLRRTIDDTPKMFCLTLDGAL
jgi:quinol monooxygenase YgiN